ncbi:MAG: TetR/AcrR family transcriptional regulator [Microthrixaceae bacterium]|nr:TetR/AcrR family transcriptional regulator [Microthrixaceae bacterium]
MGTQSSRSAILDAATGLMAERGFAATSIGSICSATGLAPTAIYWHFGSKEGLLAAIVESNVSLWYAELVEAMGGELPEDGRDPAMPTPDLGRFFAVMVDAYRRRPQALRLMLWLGLDRGHPDPEVRAAVRAARHKATELIAASISDALGPTVPTSTLKEACERLARLILVQLDGIFVAHEVDDDIDRLDELFELAYTAVVAAGIELLDKATLDPAAVSEWQRSR